MPTKTTKRAAKAPTTAPTRVEYGAFQQAYDHFNKVLFGGTLPHVLVTLQRRSKMRGYYRHNSFTAREGDSTVSELALNPDTFKRTDAEILSTLVHEQCHVWQYAHGNPKPGYHNREWADKMLEVGLTPSHNGQPGGKQTGQSCTHYITEGGAFAAAYAKLAATGFRLNWVSAPTPERVKRATASKTKFTCPCCGQNAWAKPTAVLVCGDCEEPMED